MATITNKTIAFLGCGKLATSMVRGLLQQGQPAKNIIATRRNQQDLAELTHLGVNASTDNSAAIAKADLIVLAVRPSQAAGFIQETAADINQRQVPVISVVAGLSLESLAKKLQVPLIRSMPNIAGSIGLGVTIFQLAEKDAELEAIAIDLFSPLGIAIQAQSSTEIDSFTSISGCGPAYFFYIVKILCDQARERGLDEKDAYAAILQTIKGAAALLEKEQKKPAELIDEIAAPNEPTATRRALDFMQDKGLEEIIKQGCLQAEQRATEMGKEMEAGLK